MAVAMNGGGGDGRRQWRWHDRDGQRQWQQNGWQYDGAMMMWSLAITIDGGGGNGQWWRDGNLMGDGNGNVIAMGNGSDSAIDGGTALICNGNGQRRRDSNSMGDDHFAASSSLWNTFILLWWGRAVGC
jgi:hypothetical protein